MSRVTLYYFETADHMHWYATRHERDTAALEFLDKLAICYGSKEDAHAGLVKRKSERFSPSNWRVVAVAAAGVVVEPARRPVWKESAQ